MIVYSVAAGICPTCGDLPTSAYLPHADVGSFFAGRSESAMKRQWIAEEGGRAGRG